MLVITGWACCDAWQHWKAWDNDTFHVAMESLRSQVKRLRIHPSVMMFLYSSDELPPKDVELGYLKVFNEEHWPNCVLSSASDRTSPITGKRNINF